MSVFYNTFIRNENIIDSVLQYKHTLLLGKNANQAPLCQYCGSLFSPLSFHPWRKKGITSKVLDRNCRLWLSKTRPRRDTVSEDFIRKQPIA